MIAFRHCDCNCAASNFTPHSGEKDSGRIVATSGWLLRAAPTPGGLFPAGYGRCGRDEENPEDFVVGWGGGSGVSKKCRTAAAPSSVFLLAFWSAAPCRRFGSMATRRPPLCVEGAVLRPLNPISRTLQAAVQSGDKAPHSKTGSAGQRRGGICGVRGLPHGGRGVRPHVGQGQP